MFRARRYYKVIPQKNQDCKTTCGMIHSQQSITQISMKTIFRLFIFLLSASGLYAQSIEVVETKDITDLNRNGKSYEYTGQVRLVPPFTFSAASQGAFFCRPFSIQNQPPTLSKNFVRTEAILVQGITDPNAISPLPVQSKSTEYSYLDGLGRPIQSVVVQSSPSMLDVVKLQKYDGFGRQPQEFLSYAISNIKGGYRPSSESEELNFYKTTPLVSWDDEPYKLNEYDNSPLNQMRKSYGAGRDWHVNGKASESKMLANTASDGVRFFTYIGASTTYPYYNVPTLSGTYLANTLMVEESKNEEGQIKRIFKNFKGQTILSRVGDGTSWFDTNYVYDWEGNVFCVFPPEASAKLSTAANYETATEANKNLFLENNAFKYEYDQFQRAIGKKIPGSAWVRVVYDKWDRVVMTWNGAEGTSQTQQWQFTKYDEFNRPIMTGFFYVPKATQREDIQYEVDYYYNTSTSFRFEVKQNNPTGYTLSRTYPINPTETDLLTVTYYDDYSFLSNYGWDAESIQSFPGGSIEKKSYNYVQENYLPVSTALLASYKGYTTGSKVRVLGDSRWLNSVTYYDSKYRVIQTITENHLNGGGFATTDRLSSEIDFAGRTRQTLRTHTTSAGSFTLLEKYDYDHTGRLLKTWQTLDGAAQPTLVAAQTYNEAGEVVEKNIHSTDNGTSFLQSVDYRYNIRGWLTSINNSSLTNDGSLNNDNNDIMGMELLYNTSIPINGVASRQLWNGNIGAIKWKTTNLVDPAKEKIFGFNYDVLNRLSTSTYATKPATTFTGDVGAYDNAYSYDLNGNIKTLTRNGILGGAIKLIDNLSYGYTNGNTLQYVNDGTPYAQFGGKGLGFVEKTNMVANEYAYDGRGNATQDVNKGIDVTYNHLSMPTRVDFGGGNYILYTYDALGGKLKDQVYKSGSTPITRDYIGGVHYENNTLAFLANSEGRAIKTGTQWQYEYFLRDHQGNTLATFGNLKDASVYKACMEPEKASYEESGNPFKNISASKKSALFNSTPVTAEIPAPSRSFITNGSSSTTAMGPGIKLTVNTGDRIKMSVQARSITPSSGANADVIAGSLVSLVTTGLGITTGEPAYAGFNNNLDGAAGTITASSSSPKAYLNYILFNSSYTGTPQFGYVPVTSKAAMGFENVEMEITIPAGYANGFIYIYTNNESNYDVFFDDMYILHEKTTNSLQVTQLSDYYPFGLGFNVWNKESIKANRYLYQKQQAQDDLGYDEYQYKYRMHDPAMGRFLSVDPLSEKYMYNSTYAFSENRVIDGVELEGKEFMPSGPLSYFMYQNRNNWDGGYLTGSYDFGKYSLNSWANSALGYFKGGMRLGQENYNYKNNLGAYDPEVGLGNSTKSLLHMTEQSKNYAETIQGFNTITGTALGLESTLLGLHPSLLTPSLGLGGKFLSSRSGFSIGNGADYVAPMNVVREIQHGEKISDLVSLAQNRTFSTGVEHAIVRLGPNSVAPNARVLVSGGRDGISFVPGQIKTLFGHTHPYVTGASSADSQALMYLNQSKQYIYEGFNPTPILLRK
jgi:RHS repeat-associated protein